MFSEPRPLFPQCVPAEVGVVDFHPAVELAALLAQAHGLHDFVFDEPGRVVAHPELAHQLQRRDVVLRLGEQLHGQEPARQRQLGDSKIVLLIRLYWWAQAPHCQ